MCVHVCVCKSKLHIELKVVMALIFVLSKILCVVSEETENFIHSEDAVRPCGNICLQSIMRQSHYQQIYKL